MKLKKQIRSKARPKRKGRKPIEVEAASAADAEISSDEIDDDMGLNRLRSVLCTAPKESRTVPRSTGRCRACDSNRSKNYRYSKLDLRARTDDFARTASLSGEESLSIPETDLDIWALANVPQGSSVVSNHDLSSLPETEASWEMNQQGPIQQEVLWTGLSLDALVNDVPQLAPHWS